MRLLLRLIILLSTIIIASALPGQAQDFPDVCQEPANILHNCTFNAGLDGWQTFTETGTAFISVLQGGGECHAPLCPAAYIVVEEHFVGGLYQQVSVSKGNNYYANIVWLVFDSLANDAGIHQATGGIGRKIGLDPYGGTDSTSPNIIWAPDNWRNDCKICNIEQVTITAQADTITLFLRLDDTWKLRGAEKGYPIPPSKDKFWIDDLGLKPVADDAILTQPSSTNTAVPPTDTPVAIAPSPTPTSPPTEAPTSAPLSPTASPTSTNTPPAAPPTLTPSSTPSATRTPKPRPTPTPGPTNSTIPPPEHSDLPIILNTIGFNIFIGGVILMMAATVLAGLIWLYRAGWHNSDDNDDNAPPLVPPPPGVDNSAAKVIQDDEAGDTIDPIEDKQPPTPPSPGVDNSAAKVIQDDEAGDTIEDKQPPTPPPSELGDDSVGVTKDNNAVYTKENE